MSVRFVPVCEAIAIPPGRIRGVEASGRRLAIANVAGECFAFLAACPHQAGPLDEGTLWGYDLDCPHHHYLYDVRTGENLFPRRVYPSDLAASLNPLRTFRTRVVDGVIEVELPG